ncbi:MAG: restriction endonuclease [Phycisphaerales bacterium]|nr:MAG: restriction endonuclease [Phycisphaerales bacterium]
MSHATSIPETITVDSPDDTMAGYTFHSLSDADFEDLVCDLLGAELGVTLQPFAKGRDSGIDLLHGTRIYDSMLVQCKHYCRSKYADLKHKIITTELPKIVKLKPSRFILSTSLDLTPQNKDELLNILTPYCKGVNDIYGNADLNALLRTHSDVENAHYKLWLTSVPVLQRMLRHGAAMWNAMSKNDIERQMSLYVQTDAFSVAMNILHANNYCILSGIPGIGKTTLAQVLVAKLMDDGYELIAVRDNIHEAFDSLHPEKRQVVYYDDFLGQSSVSEKLGKNEDHGIVRLLTHARHTKHLKVVLTTREYILEDAKRVYEPLSRTNLDLAKCIIKVEDYTRGHRARILYNHVYFSDLPREYAMSVLKDKCYRRIIDHNGYSPRIVEWMTLGAGSYGVPPSQYVDKFVQSLDNPSHLWQHAFDNQINDDARAILFTLGTIEGWMGLDELRNAWARIRRIDSSEVSTIENRKRFIDAMRQLEGSFTRSTRDGSRSAISFHNPSIKDYVRKRIIDEFDVRRSLLSHAIYFEQVDCLVNIGLDGKVGTVPSGLIPNNHELHTAIRRTIHMKAGTYRLIHIASHLVPDVFLVNVDVCKRLSKLIVWANAYDSIDLLQICCDIANDLIQSGDAERVVSLNGCYFLTSLQKALPGKIQVDTIVHAFLPIIESLLCKFPSREDWLIWTQFVKENGHLIPKDVLEEWSYRVESFCVEEIDNLIENAVFTSDLEEGYDEVQQLAEYWDISTRLAWDTVYEKIAQLTDYDDTQDYDDDRTDEPSIDRTADSDAAIDQLFNSLSE